MKKNGDLHFEVLCKRVDSYMKETGIRESLSGGVLLALSGGADSVFLAYLLSAMAKSSGFPLAALHVHHGLRGAEADRDAAFCRSLAEQLAIPIEISRVDVRKEAERRHMGIEEAARILRYTALDAERKRRGFAVVATAHHANDHCETVIYNLLRGGGTRALLGIRPRRDFLVRPLLCVRREEIQAALSEMKVPFVTDSTNADAAYTRNYLRAEILPRLARIVPAPELSILRASETVSHDIALLDELADDAFQKMRTVRGVSAAALRSLPEALLRRVVVRLYEAARDPKFFHVPLEHTHIVAISELLRSEKPRFSVAAPSRLFARLSGDEFFFFRPDACSVQSDSLPLKDGENFFGTDFRITVSRSADAVFLHCSSKFYKMDTRAAISPDIIEGELYVRGRREGDSYPFRGHTHSLKKLYNERKIPVEMRAEFPVVCDSQGILWVPSFPVREKRSLCD